MTIGKGNPRMAGMTGLVSLEGKISVEAALRARLRKFEVVLVSTAVHEDKIADVVRLAEECRVPLRKVPPAALEKMTHGKTHGGVVATCTDRSITPLDDLISSRKKPHLLLYLEGIEDVRTLGQILRSADAFGVTGVLVRKHKWDFDSGDLSRASSGSYEHLPFHRFEGTDVIGRVRKEGISVVGCIAGVRRTIYEGKWERSTMIAIGGEKRGLSGATREQCDSFLKIPTREGAPSLTSGHAAAIVLAEARHVRG
jgi:23S rRNA (guanosine2251-2'-O)-methyltransferase